MNSDRRLLASRPSIVVGVSDSEPRTWSADLRYAAAESLARGADLRVVHAAATTSSVGNTGDYVTQERMHHGERVLTAASRILRELTGGKVVITTVNSTELAADALLAESGWAVLVVLNRTTGSAPGLVPGHSTIGTLAGHAPCPVVITPVADVRHHPTGGVAVALADRGTNRDMVLLAASVASRWEVPLTVMQVRDAPVEEAVAAGHFRASQLEGAAARTIVAGSLSDALAAVAADYPDVAVRTTLVRGPVVDALVDVTRQSILMVIARNGAPHASGPGLGLVPGSLITRAHCPVMIVPPAPGPPD